MLGFEEKICRSLRVSLVSIKIPIFTGNPTHNTGNWEALHNEVLSVFALFFVFVCSASTQQLLASTSRKAK